MMIFHSYLSLPEGNRQWHPSPFFPSHESAASPEIDSGWDSRRAWASPTPQCRTWNGRSEKIWYITYLWWLLPLWWLLLGDWWLISHCPIWINMGVGIFHLVLRMIVQYMFQYMFQCQMLKLSSWQMCKQPSPSTPHAFFCTYRCLSFWLHNLVQDQCFIEDTSLLKVVGLETSSVNIVWQLWEQRCKHAEASHRFLVGYLPLVPYLPEQSELRMTSKGSRVNPPSNRHPDWNQVKKKKCHRNTILLNDLQRIKKGSHG